MHEWSPPEWSTPRHRKWWEGCGVGDNLPSHAERLAKIKYYELAYAPDLSEGRGWHRQCLIAIDGYPYCAEPEIRLRHVTLLLAGSPIQFIMGSAPTAGWHIRASSAEAWDDRHGEFAKGTFHGGYSHALFLSDGPVITGWPHPAWFGDMETREKLVAKMEHLTVGKMFAEKA